MSETTTTPTTLTVEIIEPDLSDVIEQEIADRCGRQPTMVRIYAIDDGKATYTKWGETHEYDTFCVVHTQDAYNPENTVSWAFQLADDHLVGFDLTSNVACVNRTDQDLLADLGFQLVNPEDFDFHTDTYRQLHPPVQGTAVEYSLSEETIKALRERFEKREGMIAAEVHAVNLKAADGSSETLKVCFLDKSDEPEVGGSIGTWWIYDLDVSNQDYSGADSAPSVDWLNLRQAVRALGYTLDEVTEAAKTSSAQLAALRQILEQANAQQPDELVATLTTIRPDFHSLHRVLEDRTTTVEGIEVFRLNTPVAASITLSGEREYTHVMILQVSDIIRYMVVCDANGVVPADSFVAVYSAQWPPNWPLIFLAESVGMTDPSRVRWVR